MLHLQTSGRHYEKAGEKITCDTQAPDDGMRRLPPPGLRRWRRRCLWRKGRY